MFLQVERHFAAGGAATSSAASCGLSLTSITADAVTGVARGCGDRQVMGMRADVKTRPRLPWWAGGVGGGPGLWRRRGGQGLHVAEDEYAAVGGVGHGVVGLDVAGPSSEVNVREQLLGHISEQPDVLG